MVGFILACTGHRNRAVAGSNPALPTKLLTFPKECLGAEKVQVSFRIMNDSDKKMNAKKKIVTFTWQFQA